MKKQTLRFLNNRFVSEGLALENLAGRFSLSPTVTWASLNLPLCLRWCLVPLMFTVYIKMLGLDELKMWMRFVSSHVPTTKQNFYEDPLLIKKPIDTLYVYSYYSLYVLLVMHSQIRVQYWLLHMCLPDISTCLPVCWRKKTRSCFVNIAKW